MVNAELNSGSYSIEFMVERKSEAREDKHLGNKDDFAKAGL